ncbi:hypothetical protein CEY16_05090 [Halalkalibacillus sediminis]|uniref:LysM domain-containing protein n=1 Tax=Halalkalibacillus sediminis TaxID=2018042 RepID=A0A2I0QXT4_9BACI|nr:LysM peptidoglycan-binding domain-containing protein [Halalkalibacillus sediminis]PKR79129.1 hypothetical protein CEY16_05090 [Halalkalibacillus sediminis]
MSHYENDPFLFDLSEKINFRQGDEIDDLYGISVEPEISVIHEDDFIQLRGVLVISGDYQSMASEAPLYMVDDQEENNYVHHVRALDNGFTNFQYPIPVDITIPRSKINETDELRVEVQYFDYEIPEPSTMNVFTKIRLEGVEWNDQSSSEANSDFSLKGIPPQDVTFQQPYQPPQPPSSYNEPESEPAEQREDQSADKGREFWQKKESKSFKDFFYKKEENLPEDNVSPKKQNQPKKEEVPESNAEPEYEEKPEMNMPPENKEMVQEAEQKENEKMEAESELDENVSPEEEVEDGKKKKKGLSYLSNFFRDGEAGSTKMKIRFVQQNETIQSIAEDYKVPVSKLERINQLEAGHDLQAGDLLYVPASGEVKSIQDKMQ